MSDKIIHINKIKERYDLAMKTLKKTKKLTAVFLVMVLFFSFAFTFVKLNVSAANFTGKGTKSDPYLIQTAEQLQAMRDNLSAHYKLANTIDLSGFGEFTPVGNLAKPFTGSFTCDNDADGTPKYAIKNLKVYNHAGEKYGHKIGVNNYVDYKENNSNWEAALFGAARGATFRNIAIIDADITNTVVGQNQMNSDWSRNPGQDEMATGTLVGYGKAITVENCSSTGKITSKSNWTGGLLGSIHGSTVKNSYSTVTVNCTGYWHVAGFCGGGEGSASTFTNCFAAGTVGPGKYLVSGFSNAAGKYENCYSTGHIDQGHSFSMCREAAEMKNCVTLSTSNGDIEETLGEFKTGNCLVLSGAEGGIQKGFTVASKSQIQSVINSINSNIKIISNTGKYVPGEVKGGNTNTNTNAGNTVEGPAESDEEPVKQLTAEEIIALTNELVEKALKKVLTLDEALEGLKIKEYYVDMTEEEKAKVPESTLASFETIYNESSKVALSEITKLVKELPDAEDITADNAEEVIALWEKYNSLPESVKEYFEKEVVDKLTACYKAAENMKNMKIVNTQVDSGMTRLETVLIIVLIVLDGIALCGLVVLMVFIIKTLKKFGVNKSENKNK